MNIQNPNSSGQGYCAQHADNPYHSVLAEFGCKYSHSTPITRGDGSKYVHHTYRMPVPDWNVGISLTPGIPATASKGGSGRKTVFFGPGSLRKYLQRKLRGYHADNRKG